MEKNGIGVEALRPVEYYLAFGVYPDMTERRADRDDWPMLYEKVHAADILVIGSPIWLGEKSSVCTQVIKRLYSCSALLNDSGWIGEAGPGPSSGGPENEFTQRNTTFMTWNLIHFARMLKDAGGIPAHGNQRAAWDAGCRFDHANLEHR